jgi:ATP-dependent Clp protease ATP-binding subunit ClpA
MRSNIKGLNPYCTRALEAASGLCMNRSRYEVAVEHMLLHLMDDTQADMQQVLKHFDVDPACWIKQLRQEIEGFKNGNPGKPVFASSMLSWFEDAWMLSSVQLGQQHVRSAALAENPMRYSVDYLDGIDKVSGDELEPVRCNRRSLERRKPRGTVCAKVRRSSSNTTTTWSARSSRAARTSNPARVTSTTSSTKPCCRLSRPRSWATSAKKQTIHVCDWRLEATVNSSPVFNE